MNNSIADCSSSSLNLIRTVHPVGQGAFYSETFIHNNDVLFTAVYDCGGIKNKLLTEINKLSRVDLFFISHFHDDHVRGAQKLIDKFKPKIVVFPHVSPCRFLVDFIRNTIRDKTGSSCVFMLNVLPIMWAALSDNSEYVENQNVHYCAVKKKYSFQIPPIDGKWEYISFCQDEDLKEQELLAELESVLKLPVNYRVRYLEKSDYQKIASLLNNESELLIKVKQLYKRLFPKGHNAYSMPVLSHEVYDSLESKVNHFDCLYTGDIVADDWLYGIVSEFEPNYIQMPHHGSNDNHNDRIYDSGKIAFVSVGTKNRYHHPGLIALPYVIVTCKEVHIVTEYPITAYQSQVIL